MSKSKHTPGPWTYSMGSLDFWIGPTNYKGMLMCTPSILCGGDRSEHEANARLIAAAPDMLAALHTANFQIISLLNEGDFKRNVTLDLGYLVDAIAKAEGKS